jgi:translation initiation factor 2B subunit (eIF-2B alpha/beta/delta family)
MYRTNLDSTEEDDDTKIQAIFDQLRDNANRLFSVEQERMSLVNAGKRLQEECTIILRRMEDQGRPNLKHRHREAALLGNRNNPYTCRSTSTAMSPEIHF